MGTVVSLNKNKRDRRSIEEIQQHIHQRRTRKKQKISSSSSEFSEQTQSSVQRANNGLKIPSDLPKLEK